MSFKELKKNAKKAFFKHYILFVFLCLSAAMLSTDYSTSYDALTKKVKTIISGDAAEDENDISYRLELDDALLNSIKNKKEADNITAGLLANEEGKNAIHIGKHIEIGHGNGVLARIRNQIVSQAFILTLLASMTATLGSASAAIIIATLLAFTVVFLVWMFFLNVYKVAYARIFMEGRIYKKVPLQRITFLMYVKKWTNASVTMLLKSLYWGFWMLTIVGGIIKGFSYFAVPYIVAENPGIPSRKAIKLSRDMMNGHKWECFKLYVTFFGWGMLDVFTFGLSGILYSNPYKEATYCEYYAYLRKLALEQQMSGTEYLNDKYLFEQPSKELLTQIYGKAEDYQVTEQAADKNFWEKLGDFFGIYVNEKKNEKDKLILKQKSEYARVKYVLNQEEYGYRFLPIPEVKRRGVLEFLQYDRKYSLWSLGLFYLFFSFIGWLWEVSLHLISDGEFVNRGTMHGPWLPIYGSGAIIILVLLKKLRKKPVLEFIGGVFACGVIEYFSGLFLELTHNGQRWWNYTGYFINIDGRVCAEGLLVFGLGGMAIVYFLAPIFDNFVRRFAKKKLIIVCMVLFIIFWSDSLFSTFKPNTGAGITSFRQEKNILEKDKLCC